MVNELLVAISIVVQLAVALLAFKQGRMGKAGLGWGFIATALVLMAVQRLASLAQFREWIHFQPLVESANFIMLVVSGLMLVGIARIGPLLSRMREEAERMAREERRLRNLVDAMPVMIHAHGPDGRIVFWNKECERVTGYTAQDMLGTGGKDDMLCRGRARLPGNGPWVKFPWTNHREVEQTFTAKDGTTRVVLLSNVSHESPLPGWAWWLAGQDVTRRRRAERRLKEQSESYRKLFDSAMDAIVVMDAQSGQVMDANPAALTMFGYGREEMFDLSVATLSANHERARDRFSALMQHGSLPRTRARQLRKDGSVFHSELSAATFETMGRKYVCVFFRDVSNEVVIKNRLEKAVRQARRANQAKSEFLANMSHEIRTPISGLIGTAQMALASERRGTQTDYLRRIETAARALLSIVNDILDMSKIEAKQLEFREVDFSPADVVRTCVGEFSALAQTKGLSLYAEVEPDVPGCLRGDPDRLAQVLRNLVNNALKFTERGSISITTRPDNGGDEPGALLFSVRDTGIGIPRDKQKDLFKPFHQLDATYAKRHQGTGLGLSISKRLVEYMGGDIWVESTEGVGSEFCFTARFSEAVVEHCPWQPELETPVQLPPLRILLAEDELLNREVVTFFLSGEGHTVEAAANGREALALLEKQDFNVVLMDVQMPELDGVETTRRIRAMSRPNKAGVPIIALTAYAMKEDRERVLEAGMDGYLSKPLDMGELYRCLARLLHRQPKVEQPEGVAG